ncbi:MAG: hypothetical protein ACK4YQ_18925 [Phenylobacterium sp.]|uniref:hypothetical protein n=1 Tax=Phenylobacterium sp. TaxID=1871053 RepID=UPI003919AA56
MTLTEYGFLAAGALAVAAGLTAPLRPDMLARKETSTAWAFAAAAACLIACAMLIVAAPRMLQDTPLAAVLALSVVHAAVTAVKWRKERLAAPRGRRERAGPLSRNVA